jgi:hypothetical protein
VADICQPLANVGLIPTAAEPRRALRRGREPALRVEKRDPFHSAEGLRGARAARGAHRENSQFGDAPQDFSQNSCNTSSPSVKLLKRRRSLHLGAVRLCCPPRRGGRPAVLGGFVFTLSIGHRARDDGAHHPKNLSKSPSNSLRRNILPATYLFLIFCARNPTYPNENKDLGEGGGGYRSPSEIPFWESEDSPRRHGGFGKKAALNGPIRTRAECNGGNFRRC